LVVLAAATITLAGGCVSHPPAGQRQVLPLGKGPGAGTIVWLSSPTTLTASDDIRQVLADAFEQAYPSIKVELVTGPNSTDRLRSILVSELSAGSATPDVYSGDIVWPYEFARAGLALPISSYLPKSFWEQYSLPGSRPGASPLIQAVSYRGQVYAVPYFLDEGFLYYRKDLLAKAGLRPPATWEQLMADSRVLKRKHLRYQFVWQGNDYEGLTCVWTEILADAFGGLPTHQNVAAELASPQALRALRFLRHLITSGVSPPTTGTFEEIDTDNAFDSGHAAFMRGWDSAYSNALGGQSAVASRKKVGVMPPPRFSGQHGRGWSVIGGWSIFVNPHSRNLTADRTFAAWVAGPQAQRIIATQYSQIPGNARIGHDPAVVATNPVLRAAADTRLVSRPAATPAYPGLSQAIHAGIHAALPGQFSAARLTPCQALLRAARKINPRVHGTLRCGSGSRE
jgi:trehalose/maltose transport system substrate-binding protein